MELEVSSRVANVQEARVEVDVQVAPCTTTASPGPAFVNALYVAVTRSSVRAAR